MSTVAGAEPWRDHYATLGVPPDASRQQIASAYRRLVRTLHPDTGTEGPEAGQRFTEVVAAYAVLRDSKRRAAYDAERGNRAAGGAHRITVRVTRTRQAAPGFPPPLFPFGLADLLLGPDAEDWWDVNADDLHDRLRRRLWELIGWPF
ncbi:J domain-containing protein [Microtetraspora fusca]|uniref:J domain-containing protein n=1 Tax=Microtetraspora fusca TaxID=1997 RepID=UPI00082B076A|nr:J domain-containing protein [Microtetraspora fusca]